MFSYLLPKGELGASLQRASLLKVWGLARDGRKGTNPCIKIKLRTVLIFLFIDTLFLALLI